MKPYIDFLFEKKSYYQSIGDVGMSNTFKILANSLFGVTMTRYERFKSFKIVTNEQQVDKDVKKPNFNSRNITNYILIQNTLFNSLQWTTIKTWIAP